MSGPPPEPRECATKWHRLLEGLDDDQKLITAWVIEQEVRFLQTHRFVTQPRRYGERARHELLKRTLPVLRLAVVAMFPSSAVDRLARVVRYPIKAMPEEVRDAVREALFQVAESEISLAKGSPIPLPGPEEDAIVNTLADRVLKAICAYPMEPGRTVV